MKKILDGVRQIRASNIIFLFMIPVIAYLLLTSRNYLPALHSVLGIEDNASELLISFIVICVITTSTFAGSLNLFKSIRIDQKQEIVSRTRSLAAIFFTLYQRNSFFSKIFLALAISSCGGVKTSFKILICFG